MECICYSHAVLTPLGRHVWIEGNTLFLTVFFSLKHTKKSNAISLTLYQMLVAEILFYIFPSKPDIRIKGKNT